MTVKRPWLGLVSATFVLLIAGCGGGHRASSTTAASGPSPAYLDCETAANVARAALAYAAGGFAPGNLDGLIASSSERAVTALRQGEGKIRSTSAGGGSASDQRLVSQLSAAAGRLVQLARQARRNHQKQPTGVLQSFGADRAELNTLCPPSASGVNGVS
jgi:hypothetical protein